MLGRILRPVSYTHLDVYKRQHTHTVLSGHAHSTLLENLLFAKKKGLEGIVVTDHSGGMEGVQSAACVGLLRDVPQEYDGVRIYRGTETNIINSKGEAVSYTHLDVYKRQY